MKLNTKSLRDLCNIHSVTGDTQIILKYLEKKLNKFSIKSSYNGFGVLIFGNLDNPKLMISAHVDEVGFQIVKQNEDHTFSVIPSGAIDPVMLNNNSVYIQSSNEEQIHGFFYPRKEIGNNKPENFNEIFLDVLEPEKIDIGDYGSYSRVFHEANGKIIATGLDNKISVQLIFDLIETHPEMMKNTLFAFVTEEETTYDCLTGIASEYKPEYSIVLDMIPVHQKDDTKVESIPIIQKGSAILYTMHDYHIHPKIKSIIQEIKTPFQKSFISIDFAPEQQSVQKNGITKGIGVNIPMFGWHNSAYSMYISDYTNYGDLIYELHKLLILN